jgi:hypothetical protein
MNRSLQRLVCQVFAGILFIGVIGNAHADTIVTNALVYAEPGTGGEYVGFGIESGPGVIVTALSTLSVSASGQSYVLHGDPETGSGFIDLYYYYYVTGPGNIPIPLVIAANLNASVSGVSAEAQATLYYTSTVEVCADSAPTACGGLPSSDVLNAPFSVPSNTMEEIELSVLASGVGVLGSSDSAEASIDPVITIDPTFLAENPGYSLLLSPNVSQGVSTPEPGTLALFLTGPCILLGAIRRWLRTLAVC